MSEWLIVLCFYPLKTKDWNCFPIKALWLSSVPLDRNCCNKRQRRFSESGTCCIFLCVSVFLLVTTLSADCFSSPGSQMRAEHWKRTGKSRGEKSLIVWVKSSWSVHTLKTCCQSVDWQGRMKTAAAVFRVTTRCQQIQIQAALHSFSKPCQWGLF